MECHDSPAIARAFGLPQSHILAKEGAYCWIFLKEQILKETSIEIEVTTVCNGPGQIANVFAFGNNHLIDMLPKIELIAKAVVNVLGMRLHDMGWFLDATWWQWKTTDEIRNQHSPELYPKLKREGADLRFPRTLST